MKSRLGVRTSLGRGARRRMDAMGWMGGRRVARSRARGDVARATVDRDDATRRRADVRERARRRERTDERTNALSEAHSIRFD